jgi:hypothetical protein
MAVLKTTSPVASPVAPNDFPVKTRPSARARTACIITPCKLDNLSKVDRDPEKGFITNPFKRDEYDFQNKTKTAIRPDF